MNPSDQQILFFSTLLQLEKQARQAQDQTELLYTVVNETIRLMKYRQAILWLPNFRGAATVKKVSGVDAPDNNAPFIRYCNKLLRSLPSNQPEAKQLSGDDLAQGLREGWTEWSFGHSLHCPLVTPKGEVLGGVLFTRDSEWQDAEISLFTRLMETYAHALAALRGKGPQRSGKVLRSVPKRLLQLLLLVGVIFLMDQPVRLSALAPMEVVPRDPLLVTSPLDSVIESFAVQPNQEVHKGDLLFTLDSTNTNNQYRVAQKALVVMETEYKREKQKSFIDPQSRAVLLNIEASIEQKKAEITYIKELLERSRIYADRDGIVVFRDTQDWLGKPVRIGEKILTIADPTRVESEIMLPVADAINLEKEAETLIFLNTKPDTPLRAKLRQASFEAEVTKDNILAFRLKAGFTDNTALPRIGLRGTAKIYGNEVPLFYYILRRPLISARQKFGM